MNLSVSCAIAVTVRGTVPLDPPTPALSNRITSRVLASASTSAGSQLSRLPRKCCNETSGGALAEGSPTRR